LNLSGDLVADNDAIFHSLSTWCHHVTGAQLNGWRFARAGPHRLNALRAAYLEEFGQNGDLNMLLQAGQIRVCLACF
jgi:hypothetical protein